MVEKEAEVGQDTGEETAEAKEQTPVNETETGRKDTVEEPAAVKEEPPVKEETKKAKDELIEAKEAEAAQATAEAKAEVKEQPPAKEEIKKPKAKKEVTDEPPAPTAKEKLKVSPAIEEIMATIKKMTVLELAELVKTLEAEFGVSAAAPVVAAAPTAPAEAAAPAAGEQTEFSVILTGIGANKINVIKAVRELTTLGLKESKDLVESAPKAVREAVNKEEAAAIKEKLEAAGATAEIK